MGALAELDSPMRLASTDVQIVKEPESLGKYGPIKRLRDKTNSAPLKKELWNEVGRIRESPTLWQNSGGIMETVTNAQAFLYTNKNGKQITAHSYSGGSDFNFCKRLYQIRKIDGWAQKEDRASKHFGICIESAIQYFHENGCVPGSSSEKFVSLWQKFAEKEIKYTDKEGGWEDLNKMGVDMMRLYEIRLPDLPIRKPKFQLNYKKPIAPGSYLDGIEFTAYVDMLTEPSTKFPYRSIIDIKTSGVSISNAPRIVSLDPQLRRYAWVSGVENVAFLWFVKARPSFSKGDWVTVLENSCFKKGEEVKVLKYDGEANSLYLADEKDYLEYEAECDKIEGKGAKEKKSQLLCKFGRITTNIRAVTKCKLQYAWATLTPEVIQETGEAIGMEIAEIYSASMTGKFPQEPSIRFPAMKCQTCMGLSLCTENETLRKETLVRINGDWLDELEDE